MSTNRNLSLPLTLVAWLVLCAGPVLACSVPVFRYALERWDASPYALVVFHRGPLTAADKKLVDLVNKSSIEIGGKANIFIRTIDVSKEMDDFEKSLWAQEDDAVLPLSVLRYPMKDMGMPGPVVWRGRLTKELVGLMLDSPARREIAKRIVGGDSAVWVYLADKPKVEKAAPPAEATGTDWRVAAPAAAAALALFALFVWSAASKRYVLCGTALVLLIAGAAVLPMRWDGLTATPEQEIAAPRPDGMALFEATLKTVQGKVQLPEIDPQDDEWGPGGSPIQDMQKNLKLNLSAVRVYRDDPEEKMLVTFLLRSEPNLEIESVGKPVVFAIFGRGRALPALVGKGITEENIGKDSEFLVGPCSCTIKRLNPGVDLLMSADWALGVQQPMVQDVSLPPLPVLSAPVSPENVVAAPLSIPAAAADLSSKPSPPPTTQAAEAKPAVGRQAIVLVVVVVLITIVMAIYARKRSSGTRE